MIKDMNKFIEESNVMLRTMVNNLEELDSISLSEITKNKTHVSVIDMNIGFAKKGNLYSPLVEGIIPNTRKLLEKVSEEVEVVFYTDSHTKESLELKNYPEHCLISSGESEIVPELQFAMNSIPYFKNSTNGFLAHNPLFRYEMNGEEFPNNFIVVGCVTDICIYQYAITLKAYLNEQNIEGEVIVPIDCVNTFNIDGIHNSEFMNIVFLNSLISNGVKVVKSIY